MNEKKPAPRIPHSAFRVPLSNGFTILEILVVVAIIMVLAGLILAALGLARDRAEDLRARSDVDQLKTAWEAYYADYSRFPDRGPGDSYQVQVSDITCVQILRGTRLKDEYGNIIYESPAIEKFRAKNPRDIPYMDFHQSTTQLLDPWGNLYRISLDTDYDQAVGVPEGTLPQSVAVWSAGRDEIDGNKDDIRSWRPF